MEALDIIATFIQHLGLIFSSLKGATYPDALRPVIEWFEAFAMLRLSRLATIFATVSLYIPEFRVQYVLRNIFVPILIATFALMFFRGVHIILWYLLLLIGATCLLVGVVSFVLPSENLPDHSLLESAEQSLVAVSPIFLVMVIGAAILCFCIFTGICYVIYNKIKKRSIAKAKMNLRNIRLRTLRMQGEDQIETDPDADLDLIKIEQQKSPKLDRFAAVRDFVVCIFSLVVGLVAVRAISLKRFGADREYLAPYASAFLVMGVVLLAVSLACAVSFLLRIFPATRLFMARVSIYFKQLSLKAIFISLSVIYIPITQSLLEAFLCEQKQCAAGSRFPTKTNTFSYETLFTRTTNDTCEACVFSYCPTNLTNVICPEISDFRFAQDYSLSCNRDMMPFFWPPSVLLGIMIVIGVPILFYMLTRKSIAFMNMMEVDHLIEYWRTIKKREADEIERSKEERRSRSLWRRVLCCFRKSNKQPRANQVSPTVQRNVQGDIITQPQMRMLPSHLTVHQHSVNAKRYYDSAYTPTNKETKMCCIPRDRRKKKTIADVIAEEQSERWLIRTSISESAVETLYNAYEYKWRYFKLILTIKKLLLTLISVLLSITTEWASLTMLLIINLCFTVLIILSRPYISDIEDALAAIANLFNIGNTIVAMLVLGGLIDFPAWVLGALLGVNVVLPAIGFIVGYASWKKRQHKLKIIRQEQASKQNASEISDAGKNYLEIANKHEALVQQLNTSSLNVVINWFMVVAILCFVALGCCMLGILYGELNPSAIPSRFTAIQYSLTDAPQANVFKACTHANDFEYAGYGSWSEFTTNCCCTPSSKISLFSTVQYPVVELWQCANQKSKERIRVETVYTDEAIFVGNISGLAIRPLCSPTFTDGFTPTVCTGGQISLLYDEAAAKTWNLTVFALAALW